MDQIENINQFLNDKEYAKALELTLKTLATVSNNCEFQALERLSNLIVDEAQEAGQGEKVREVINCYHVLQG